jgi:hypothetical protein
VLRQVALDPVLGLLRIEVEQQPHLWSNEHHTERKRTRRQQMLKQPAGQGQLGRGQAGCYPYKGSKLCDQR